MKHLINAITNAPNLDKLTDAINTLADHIDALDLDSHEKGTTYAELNIDWTGLPTWGEEPKEAHEGAYSWDDTRVMWLENYRATLTDIEATPEQQAELTTITCTVTQLEAAWGHSREEWELSGGDPTDDNEELKFVPVERYNKTSWQLHRWINNTWEGMTEQYTEEEIKELIEAL